MMLVRSAMQVAVSTTLLAMCQMPMAQQNSQATQDKILHLNQIQVIGSHNSYHAGFAASERKYMEMKNPKALRSLDYHHAPLGDQLSGGVRQVEIDVFADPEGGRFAHPAIVQSVAAAGLPADPDFDPRHEMNKPGFKVMHIQDVDERSTCHTFVACLQDIRSWSKQHPGHLPIFILVETKEDKPHEIPNAVSALPFTSAIFDALDAEIRSVFKPNEMITPDEVRGDASTLTEAVQAGKWPTLDKARGRVIFLMDQQHVGPIYTEGHPSLRGRILFTNALPGTPDAAFIEQNDGSVEAINALVKQGYLVRTRTDESTEQARANDTTRRDLALLSGAQMLSTDYPSSEPSQWTKYFVGLPNGLVARCNPVNKPAGCVDSLLEPASKTGNSPQVQRR
jgi:calcium-dependent phosphoinositide phospholipase C